MSQSWNRTDFLRCLELSQMSWPYFRLIMKIYCNGVVPDWTYMADCSFVISDIDWVVWICSNYWLALTVCGFHTSCISLCRLNMRCDRCREHPGNTAFMHLVHLSCVRSHLSTAGQVHLIRRWSLSDPGTADWDWLARGWHAKKAHLLKRIYDE